MGTEKSTQEIHTRIWLEEPEPDSPFATRAAYCLGYDVYGDMLGRASWIQMLYLLFREAAPSIAQSNLLETLAVALANPGPRDPSVHAAMCGGVSGSPSASCLMAALAVGAGQYTGAREVFHAIQGWGICRNELDAWRRWFITIKEPRAKNIWPQAEHVPGFDPHGTSTPTIVLQTLARLSELSSGGGNTGWLLREREMLEAAADGSLSMVGVAAAALADLGFDPEQGEMLYLLLRLPGAAAHALEQRGYGYKKFPFFSIELQDDPQMTSTVKGKE